MKVIVRGLIVVMLAASLIPAAAAKDSSRVVTRRYGCTTHSTGLSCQNVVEVRSRSDETRVTVRVTDDLGAPVVAEVGQDLDGDGQLDRSRQFCGFTSRFPIRGGSAVEIRVGAALVDDDCGAITAGTRGEIRIGFATDRM